MKQIVKNFNNLIKKTIFKVENKTNDKFHVSNFSKYIIAVIVVLFVYVFYLSIPLLYDKNWIQNKIVTKLGNEFNINLVNSFDFSYRILPKPHYLIKDTKTSLA
jgi:magnesium-transporting ATPase (P-type)